MKKIFYIGLSIVVLYSILAYAYGFDCQGPLNQSTYYQLNSGVTRTSSSTYYVGCALDDVAPSVRIVVFNEDSSIYVLNVLEYNVKNSNHYFYGVEGVNYSVYVGSGSTSGYALCEPQ